MDLGTGVKVDAKDSTEGTMIFLWMLLPCEHDVGTVGPTLSPIDQDMSPQKKE